ncbi:MAG: 16S rRNA (cytosine(1402)-N(4))-methyltransferase RsmH [Ardenticatenales bacterium]|nr:16S rRNA (cytosine(1402)-N(4))-methyltransferase RsmH [Ardenticatenales bacterium]MCB9171703.1 16S rRNA (cytosine(1402)-N(4))-methyltransferase RsmH [Ardenticatenales bacterium]
MTPRARPPAIPEATYDHLPVLYDEVLAALSPTDGAVYLDGTVGMGGHSWGLLHHSAPRGTLLGMDRDRDALALAATRLADFGARATLVPANFDEMGRVAQRVGMGPFDGILLDLGFSSVQMDDPERGFSFHAASLPDMRLDRSHGPTAADLIDQLSEQALADLIYRYGEERQSRRIARAIVQHRPFTSARVLGDVIAQAVRGKQGKIHPATRTFQALRIAVNDELGAVERVLPDAVALLKPHGRLAVISFHSLEDRLVKQFIRRETTDCLCPPEILFCTCGHRATLDAVLTPRKVIVPTDAEQRANPRARSAKLRIAVRAQRE